MKLFVISLAVTLGLAGSSPSEAGLSDRCIRAVDSIVTRAIADTVFPGAVVAIVRKDRIAYLKSYGAKAVFPAFEPIDDDVIYDIASLSKSVSTSLAVLQLAEEGLINLYAPVSDYIEGFADYEGTEGRGRSARRVTRKICVRDLLYHSSGLPSYAYIDRVRSDWDGDLVRYIATGARRGFRPGKRFRYSCLNYIALQAIVERVSGQRLCDYAEEHIFGPLGMKDTRYLPGGTADTALLRRIAPTEMTDSVNVRRGYVHDPLAWELMNGNSGNAGVFSTASDMAVLCAAIMNGGSLYVAPDSTLCAGRCGREIRLLGYRGIDDLFKVDEATGRTMGWDNSSDQSGFAGNVFPRGRLLCHTGFTGPSIVIDDLTKTAVIIMCNRIHPHDRGGLNYPHANLKDVRAGIADAVARSVCFGE